MSAQSEQMDNIALGASRKADKNFYNTHPVYLMCTLRLLIFPKMQKELSSHHFDRDDDSNAAVDHLLGVQD